MSKSLHTVLTRRERQIMDVLFRAGRATAAEVMDQLSGEPSYSTVTDATPCGRREGEVRHEDDGIRFVYMPAVTRQAARKSALRHLLEVARDVRRFRHPLPAALSIAHPSTLERRIRPMLDAQRPRVPLTRRIGLLATVTVLAAVVPIAGFGPPSPLRGFGEASLAPSRLMSSVPAVAETQRGTASVSGVIQDQLGGLLPGVAVTIADARSGTAFTVRSNRDGVYEFTDIPEATYTLVATLPGFRTENMGLEMRPGSRLERPIVMQIGSVQETITITGSRSTGGVPNQTPQVVPPSSPSGGRGAVPPAPAPRVSGIGGNLRAPVKIKDVKPVYPAAPQTAGVSGTVIVAGKIDVDGFVKDLNVERQLDSEFANALLDAVSQWQFVPTQLNGVPVETAITITGNFTLD